MVTSVIEKVDTTRGYTFNKEIARRFKLKHDSEMKRIRVCMRNSGPGSLVFNIYRLVEDNWIPVLNNPIVKDIEDISEQYRIVEIDVADVVEPQPKGDYLIGITPYFKQRGYKNSFTGRVTLRQLSYDRSPIDDSWDGIEETSLGMELDIEY